MGKHHRPEGTPSTATESAEDEIRVRAYELYCEGGYQNGRDLEYWLQAEQQVKARRKSHLRRVA
jgi:Protein of unknown function (DUF2934)